MHAQVLPFYRLWKQARASLKAALRSDGEKGPIVRRALRELIAARADVRKAVEAARDGVVA